jgi:uncharacterized membrane protein
MGARRIAVAWVVTFLLIFFGNVLFHGVLAAAFFDRHLQGVIVPIATVKNPVYPIVAAVFLATGMTWFTLRGWRPERGVRDASLIGAWLGLIAYGTWNVINDELIPGWSPAVMALDIPWHIGFTCTCAPAKRESRL